MADTAAIRAVGLRKEYRIVIADDDAQPSDGNIVADYGTLRDSIANGVARVLGRRKPRQRARLTALRNIDLTIPAGSVVGLIGRNGAGKSTLLKILARVTPPTAGMAVLHGRVGSLLEVGTGFHLELTGRENIYLSGAVLGLRRAEIVRHFDEIVDFAEVGPFLETPLKRYSTGMYLRLAFAVAAHLETEIMLVDEVLAVGDLKFRQRCLGKLRDVGRGGRTVIYVSHDMSSVRQLCERALWLDRGEVVDDGPAAEVTLRYEASTYARLPSTHGIFSRDAADLSGKTIWFEKVELLNSAGEPTSTFSWGDRLTLRLYLAGRAPTDGFSIEWLIINERGERAAFGAANPQQNVFFDRRDRVVDCELAALPFTAGQYKISLKLWLSHGSSVWDIWDEAAVFRIERADPFGHGFNANAAAHGVVVVPHGWRSVHREA